MECNLLLSISDHRGGPGSAATHHPPPMGGLHSGPEAASWPVDPAPLYNNQYGHTNYDNEHSVVFTPGGHRAPAYAATLTPIPQPASYEIHSSNPISRVPYTCSRRLSAKRRNTRPYQVNILPLQACFGTKCLLILPRPATDVGNSKRNATRGNRASLARIRA
jgi:hypothetical protein